MNIFLGYFHVIISCFRFVLYRVFFSLSTTNGPISPCLLRPTSMFACLVGRALRGVSRDYVDVGGRVPLEYS